MLSLEILHTDGKARAGRLTTSCGVVNTPLFMPVGTAGAVKGVTPAQFHAAGVEMVLANTYHLMLRPGAEVVADLGGLHALMGWTGPLLTDSGGFQVFSLGHLCEIDDEKVVFRSHIDGAPVVLTPERAVEIQQLLGADLIMQLDECPPADASHSQVARAVGRSVAWAKRGKAVWEASRRTHPQALLGIQQGGVFEDLREQSAAALVELDLPGYAIGGLSVGEGHDEMVRVLDRIDGQFPADRPRYLMGVGEPRDILAAVARGVDMFDCVLPTRNARNAQAFTWNGRIRLRNARWRSQADPLDVHCRCYTCRNFSSGALRHLFMAREMLAPTLMTIHNLQFFTQFMAAIRQAIAEGKLEPQTRQWIAQMYNSDEKEENNQD